MITLIKNVAGPFWDADTETYRYAITYIGDLDATDITLLTADIAGGVGLSNLWPLSYKVMYSGIIDDDGSTRPDTVVLGEPEVPEEPALNLLEVAVRRYLRKGHEQSSPELNGTLGAIAYSRSLLRLPDRGVPFPQFLRRVPRRSDHQDARRRLEQRSHIQQAPF